MDNTVFRIKELIAYTKLSQSVIYDRMNKNSPRYDSTFPKNFALGGGAVGWLKRDVDAWLLKCSQGTNSTVVSNIAEPAQLSATVRTKPNFIQTPKPTPLTSKSSGSSPSSLGQFILAGEKLNALMDYYFRLPTWTPVQAALLLSGVVPPDGCTEIPTSGVGVDGQPLTNGARLKQASDILREWKDCEIAGAEFSPNYFFNWCYDEQITTEWLKLFLELAGCANPEAAMIASSRFAMNFPK